MFIIIELQTNADGTVGNFIYTAQSANEADQIYHSKLAYAATSTVYCHAVTMLTPDGDVVKHEAYWHVPDEATPEPEE